MKFDKLKSLSMKQIIERDRNIIEQFRNTVDPQEQERLLKQSKAYSKRLRDIRAALLLFLFSFSAYSQDIFMQYRHPTTDGNLHVPATGTSNNGKFLKAGATAGSLSWVVPGIVDISGLQTALNLKAPLASPTFTGTVNGITKGMVGLGNVDNTSDASKPVSTAQQAALDLKANLANPTFTGTVNGITKGMVGLGNVDNTSDASKPVSSAQQAALDLKANLANPTFTGTVNGITKGMVGLGNVDNTSDASKPVSTAQQAALDLKAPLDSVAIKMNREGGRFTGDVIFSNNVSLSNFTSLTPTFSTTGTMAVASLTYRTRISGSNYVTWNPIRFDANGYIGFGKNPSATYPFDFLGAANFGTGLTSTTGTFTGTLSGNYANFTDSINVVKAKITSLNINTSSSRYGIINTTNSSGSYLDFRYNGVNYGHIGNGNQIYMSGNNADMYVGSQTGRVHLGTGGLLRLTVTNAGNVGIKTIAPIYDFQVSGTAGFNRVITEDTIRTNNVFAMYSRRSSSESDKYEWKLDDNGAGIGKSLRLDYNRVGSSGFSATNVMYIQNGKVLIAGNDYNLFPDPGSPAEPTASLQTNGTFRAKQNIFLDNYSGYLRGNGLSAATAVPTIPSADVSGNFALSRITNLSDSLNVKINRSGGRFTGDVLFSNSTSLTDFTSLMPTFSNTNTGAVASFTYRTRIIGSTYATWNPIRMDANGYVGIGKNPSTAFDVLGFANFDSGLTSTIGTFTGNLNGTYANFSDSVNVAKAKMVSMNINASASRYGIINTTNSFGSYLDFRYNGTNYGHIGNGSQIYMAGNNADMILGSTTGRVHLGTNSLLRLTVTNAGNVGILNNSPTYNLDVAGTFRASTSAYFATSSGNVGISTVAPISKLHINAPVGLSVMTLSRSSFTSTGGVGGIGFSNAGSTNNYVTAITSTYGTDSTSARLSLRAGAANTSVYNLPEVLTISNSGKVGIQSSAPEQALDVNGLNRVPATTGSTGDGIARFRTTGGATSLDFGGYSTGGYMWLQARSNTDFAVNYNLALQPNGGNLGINITNPSSALDMKGTLTLTAGDGAKSNAISGGYSMNGGSRTMLFDNSSSTSTEGFLFRNSNTSTNIMAIMNRGNVGIGTTLPNTSAILDLNSTTAGLGLPQLTTTQINAIATPKAGLTVYNTTLSTLCYYNGTTWKKVTDSNM